MWSYHSWSLLFSSTKSGYSATTFRSNVNKSRWILALSMPISSFCLLFNSCRILIWLSLSVRACISTCCSTINVSLFLIVYSAFSLSFYSSFTYDLMSLTLSSKSLISCFLALILSFFLASFSSKLSTLFCRSLSSFLIF